MGGSYFNRDDYDARKAFRAATSTPVFAYDADVRSGKVDAKVHKDLDPKGANRESRDSDAHPITVPIGVIFDCTGSMATVPAILQDKLANLMGTFLDDKASGKKYLGDGYPAILIGGLDDYHAQRGAGFAHGEGTLQVGQFESGMEIDQMLEKLWLTANGGGTYDESYEIAMYFMARHTVHDHWEKRGRRGYVFFIGDEHPYRDVESAVVENVIGDKLQADLALKDVVAELQERYNVFMIIPNMTNHYADMSLLKFWQDLLGQQNAMRLQDPNKICEMIASTVALCEEHIGIDDLAADGIVDDDIKKALVPIARAGGAVAHYSAAGLEAVAGDAGGVERL